MTVTVSSPVFSKKRLLRKSSDIPEPRNIRPSCLQDGVRKIRPLALADGFEPGRLCRQVQTANAGKQAHMGQCSVDFVGHLLILGIRKAPLYSDAFRVDIKQLALCPDT